MELNEYLANGYDKGAHTYQMKDGVELKGIISDSFTVLNDDNFYFIESQQMSALQNLAGHSGHEELRNRSKMIDLADVISAKPIKEGR